MREGLYGEMVGEVINVERQAVRRKKGSEEKEKRLKCGSSDCMNDTVLDSV